MAAEYDGVDALMAAITEEPLPDAALADDAFVAEHRAARADLALLREQLGIIGNALAEPEPEPEPQPEPQPQPARQPQAARQPQPAPQPQPEQEPQPKQEQRPESGRRPEPGWRPEPVSVLRPPRSRRPGLRVLGLGVLGTAVVAAVVAGMGWLVAANGGADSASSGAKASDTRAAASASAGYLACARLVVEGHVSGVESVPGTGQVRITLAADRYYKPASGPKEVTFLVDDTGPRLRDGEHVLVGIPRDSAVPDHVTVGEKEIAADRAAILGALPRSRSATCS